MHSRDWKTFTRRHLHWLRLRVCGILDTCTRTWPGVLVRHPPCALAIEPKLSFWAEDQRTSSCIHMHWSHTSMCKTHMLEFAWPDKGTCTHVRKVKYPYVPTLFCSGAGNLSVNITAEKLPSTSQQRSCTEGRTSKSEKSGSSNREART